MTNGAQRSSVILPVLLAVIGVASLATAVMLVPVIIRTSLVQVQATTPQRLPEAPTAEPPAAQPDVVDAPAATTTDTAAPAPTDSATAMPTELPSWTLVLVPRSYALDGESKNAVEAIVGYARANPKAKLALTGVNNPMRSSKRAKQAARRVKEKLITAGIERYRITVAGHQQDGAKGLVVRVEVAEGSR